MKMIQRIQNNILQNESKLTFTVNILANRNNEILLTGTQEIRSKIVKAFAPWMASPTQMVSRMT